MSDSLDAIGFDLDDTLFAYHDYARAGLAAAADHLEAVTGRSYHQELWSIYFEEGVTTGTFDHLVETADISQELVADCIERFHAADEPLEPYPDAEPTLEALGRSHRLGLLTDGRNGRAKLERLGLAEYFDAVVVTPELDRSKRELVAFRRLLEGLDVSAESAAYVGDDPRVDFEHPNTLGMTTVRLRRGRYDDLEPPQDSARPDHEIESLHAVQEILVDSKPARTTDGGIENGGNNV
jgi:putative hydrolase of the HAD superfamily